MGEKSCMKGVKWVKKLSEGGKIYKNCPRGVKSAGKTV